MYALTRKVQRVTFPSSKPPHSRSPSQLFRPSFYLLLTVGEFTMVWMLSPSRFSICANFNQVHKATPVLVVGAGPAGLIAALQLAKNGVPCLLAERNLDTTKWPKMDITNCRSMEILKRLGVADEFRKVGTCLKVSLSSLIISSYNRLDTC